MKMVTSKDLLELIYRVGYPTKVSKCDWNDGNQMSNTHTYNFNFVFPAYKHVHVRKEDTHLQFVSIGGRFFAERG